MEKNKSKESLDRKIEYLFNLPPVIGLEGGPVAGKTTLLESLKSHPNVVILPEAANVITQKYLERGIDILDLASKDKSYLYKYETEVLDLTVRQIEDASSSYYRSGKVIVADRVDIGGYLTAQDHLEVLNKFGFSTPPMLRLVDKILYFPTLARKDPDSYSDIVSSGQKRKEKTPELAVSQCDACLKSVSLHPELHYLDYGALPTTLSEARKYIDNPYSEIEIGGKISRKSDEPMSLIIEKHKQGLLLSKADIVQSYIELDGHELRIREETITKPSDFTRRTLSYKDSSNNFEVQKSIDKDLYYKLDKLSTYRIDKTRYRFLHQDELNNSVNIWNLDRVWSEEMDFGWIFEVEGTSNEYLDQLKPPFGDYRPKNFSNRDMARMALMLS